MLDFAAQKKFDSQHMCDIYDIWPEIAENAYKVDHEKIGYIGIDHIVFAGMGGSGAIGDIFSSILSNSDIHVKVVKGYQLPKTVDSNTLVITTSISGNTIETLSVLQNAKKTNCKVIAFSSGGKMEEFCKSNNINFRKIPQYHSPRASFPSFLFSMLNLLSPVLPIDADDVNESIKAMHQTKDLISSNNLTEENPSLQLANWIKGIPIIYYPWGLKSAAIRFKNSLQENAKSHVMIEDIIETCHNGIVAWEMKSNVQPILIQGSDDHIKTKERWKIVKDYFESKEIDYKEVFTEKGGILSKIVNLIYLLDYSTIYLAIRNNLDPTPITSIDFVKGKLRL